MMAMGDHVDDAAKTLALVRQIHERIVDAPLFPVQVCAPLVPGACWTSFFGNHLTEYPVDQLLVDVRVLDERRLQMQLQVNGHRAFPFIAELWPGGAPTQL